MKEKRLKILIGIMSFALIGLTSIQWYWIKNSIDIGTERFESSVNEAMANAARVLVKKEAAGYVLNVFDNGIKKYYSIDTPSTQNRKVLFINSDTTRRIVKAKPLLNELHADTLFNSFKTIIPDSLNEDIKIYRAQHPDSQNVNLSVKVMQTIIEEKSKIVKEVVNELVYYTINSSIEDRLNQDEISLTLAREFSNRGNDFEYEFNVNTGDSLLYTCDNETASDLMKSKFKTELFPDELSASQNYLLVFIPDEERIVLQSVLTVLFLSVFFTLVIIVIFYRTVALFLRQKKITEIKDDLINNITHEFKTPISTISLAVESINEPTLLKDATNLQRFSKIIKDENQRLQRMVDTLLSTAAIEKGKYVLNRTKCDLHEIINSVIKKYELLNTHNNVTITTELNSTGSQINIDEFHFTNLLSNIIDNSVKYNVRSPEIHIATKDITGSIMISFSDNGIGIEKSQINKIFDTFYRVPTGNIHDVKGYGFGLSYVKKMVEAHGGSVSVTSKLNEWTVFEILIPTN